MQAWNSGGRTTACDPHALGGDQCGERRGPDLEHCTTHNISARAVGGYGMPVTMCEPIPWSYGQHNRRDQAVRTHARMPEVPPCFPTRYQRTHPVPHAHLGLVSKETWRLTHRRVFASAARKGRRAKWPSTSRRRRCHAGVQVWPQVDQEVSAPTPVLGTVYRPVFRNMSASISSGLHQVLRRSQSRWAKRARLDEGVARVDIGHSTRTSPRSCDSR